MSVISRLMAMGAAGAISKPIEYVGGYGATVTSSTSDQTITFGGNLTGGVASSASAGDIVLVWFATGSTADRNLVVSGYTEVTELYANSVTDTNLAIAYKFMGSTPDTTFVLTGGTLNTDDAGAVAVQVFRNVKSSQPLDVATQTTVVNNSVIVNPPSITPITSGSWIVAGGAGGHRAGNQNYFGSNLTSLVKASANLNNDVSVVAGHHVWTSSVFDPTAFTLGVGIDSTDYSNASATVALKPK